MRKSEVKANKRARARKGAVMLLIACMALQAVGCSPGGKGADQAEIVQTEAAVKETEAATAETAVKEVEADRTEEAVKEADTDAAGQDKGQAAGSQDAGEGDSGIAAQPGAPLKEGNQAPDFTAQLVDGSSITLSDLKGKPVVINFWATWCGPCVKEMPAFERLKEDFGDEIGIIAVNCGDDADTVKEFVEEYGYTFPVALDESYEVSMLYPTSSIPYTVVVDANGKITHISVGALDADTMYERYKEALGV